MHGKSEKLEKNFAPTRWLNRNVVSIGLTSLLSDFCHEMATSVLPQFMQAIGASAAALGFMGGVADALSSFVKLGAGYHSDKIGHRKTWTVIGYVLTAISKAVFAFAFAWPLVLLGRAVGWLGRGIWGPLRDAILAESVSSSDRGKAFGFHRAGDTLGAIIGPLTDFGLGRPPEYFANLWALVSFTRRSSRGSVSNHLSPYFGAGTSFRNDNGISGNGKKRAPNHNLRFWSAVRQAIPKDYRLFLLGVGLFGIADFAPTLMILRATTVLEPHMGILEASRLATLFYLFRNIVYSAASYPIGHFSGRFSRSRYLAVGYGIAVVTFLGFAFAVPSVIWFVIFFGLAGIFIAWEDTIEGTAVRDYVGEDLAGTAYGILGVVNGVGDFVSSLVVGLLWTYIGASWGFGYAVIIGLAGTILMWCTPGRTHYSSVVSG